jgi:hypothetical protein
MNTTSLTSLVPILQLSIGPVILISGVGLLLLTLTNRFGRMLDRTRFIKSEMSGPLEPPAVAKLQAQIDILQRRAIILRRSITLAAVTVLSAAVLILVLFVAALLRLEWGLLIIVIFAVGQVALIGSMIAFIREMNLSLEAVRLELAGG